MHVENNVRSPVFEDGDTEARRQRCRCPGRLVDVVLTEACSDPRRQGRASIEAQKDADKVSRQRFFSRGSFFQDEEFAGYFTCLLPSIKKCAVVKMYLWSRSQVCSVTFHGVICMLGPSLNMGTISLLIGVRSGTVYTADSRRHDPDVTLAMP